LKINVPRKERGRVSVRCDLVRDLFGAKKINKTHRKSTPGYCLKGGTPVEFYARQMTMMMMMMMVMRAHCGLLAKRKPRRRGQNAVSQQQKGTDFFF